MEENLYTEEKNLLGKAKDVVEKVKAWLEATGTSDKIEGLNYKFEGLTEPSKTVIAIVIIAIAWSTWLGWIIIPTLILGRTYCETMKERKQPDEGA